MSSIPNAKMKHAHVHDDQPTDAHQPEASGASAPAPAQDDRGATSLASDGGGKGIGARVEGYAGDAVSAVKERPGAAMAIGAAVLAGAAALVGGPAIAKAIKGDDAKKGGKKKSGKKS